MKSTTNADGKSAANRNSKARPNIHGKPVFTVKTRILNPKSDFRLKGLCGGPTFSAGSACCFSCTYCYVKPMMNRGKSAVAKVLKNAGRDFCGVVIRREQPLERLRAQLRDRHGELRYKQDDRIVYASPVVDVAATVELADETVELCGEVLENTGWTIRLLSKSTLLGRIAGKIPAKWSRRIIYGVSTGTFDDEVAAAIEPDAPPPSKRLETLAELQRQGLRTFAMLCPILPQDPILFVKTASDRIDFRKCQHVWAEVLNRRGNSMERTARALEQAGLESWAERLHRVYGDGSTPQWEAYARSTFAALSAVVPSGKLRFMQYVTPRSVEWWRGHEKLGAMVLGAAANRNGEPTEGETRRKAKRSEAAKKAQVTIRANRAKRGSTDRLPRPKTSKQPVTQR